jgi:ABC-type transporter Mla subunit MlaD
MTREEIRSGVDAVLESLDEALDTAADRGFDVSRIRESAAGVADALAEERGQTAALAA